MRCAQAVLQVAMFAFLPAITAFSAPNPDWEGQRNRMVRTQLEERGIRDPAVLKAMREVPRHRFVPEMYRYAAYEDRPLSIGKGQTISQPYIVGLMTQLAKVQPEDRVLEVGTGSGYQAAVLAELADTVYTVEIVEALGTEARHRLRELGYDNVRVRIGDGFRGWPEHAPFDAVVVTCAPPQIPGPLKEQLVPGGRLVIPVGEGRQELKVVEKGKDGSLRGEEVIPVRFVPMTGKGVKGMGEEEP